MDAGANLGRLFEHPDVDAAARAAAAPEAIDLDELPGHDIRRLRPIAVAILRQ